MRGRTSEIVEDFQVIRDTDFDTFVFIVRNKLLLTPVGTLTTPGLSAVSPRTTSCRSGRWQSTSTMTRSRRLQQQRPANEDIFILNENLRLVT